jgi:acyl-coenzyme A thioesterase PaaI-like protein
MCFACGRQNPIGLHLQFFTDGDKVTTTFTPRPEHQGFPGVMHGGLVSTVLDEVIGRVAINKELWMMTAKLEVRYKKPVPIGQPLTVTGEITHLTHRLMEGRGEIRLADGSLAVEAIGTYIRMPHMLMDKFKSEMQYWYVEPEETSAEKE